MDFFASPQHRDFWAAPMARRFELPPAADDNAAAAVNADGSVEFSLPVEGFAPEDLEIKVAADGRLRLRASREEKDAKGNVVSSRRVDKSFSLPPDCDVDAIRSRLNQDGTLRIVVPKREREVGCEGKREAGGKTSEVVELAAVPVNGYAPEELTVAVSEDGRAVEISGRQEERDGGGAVVASRQFAQTFPIPDCADSESVKSELSKHGILSVTAERSRN